VDPHHPRLSIRRQCDLLGLNRSSYYVGASWDTQTPENLEIMERHAAYTREYLGWGVFALMPR
jgi:hypothetical protein